MEEHIQLRESFSWSYFRCYQLIKKVGKKRVPWRQRFLVATEAIQLAFVQFGCNHHQLPVTKKKRTQEHILSADILPSKLNLVTLTRGGLYLLIYLWLWKKCQLYLLIYLWLSQKMPIKTLKTFPPRNNFKRLKEC